MKRPGNTKSMIIRLGSFGGMQIGLQALNILVGLVILREFHLHEYGVYTLCTGFLGTLAVLSDGGIDMALIAMAASNPLSKTHVGASLDAASKVRNRLATVMSCVSFPVLGYLLSKQGAEIFTILILSFVCAVSLFVSLQCGIYASVFRVCNQVLLVQKIELAGAIGRLLLTVSIILVSKSAYGVLAAAAVSPLLSIVLYRKLLHRIAMPSCSSPKQRAQIWASVKDLLPATIYWCLSGNVAVWALGLQGRTINIGQVGGLGRLSQGFQFIGAIIGYWIVPSFARARSYHENLRRFVFPAIIFPVVFCSIIVIICHTPVSELAFYVLGPQFDKMNVELELSLAASAFGIYGGMLLQLCAARGWRLKAWIAILPNFACLMVALSVIDTSTLRGILYLNLAVTLPNVVLFLWLGTLRLVRYRTETCNDDLATVSRPA